MTPSKRYYVEVEKTDFTPSIVCYFLTSLGFSCLLIAQAEYTFGLTLATVLGFVYATMSLIFSTETIRLPVSQGIKEEKVKG